MSVRVEAAPRQGRRRDRPSTEGSEGSEPAERPAKKKKEYRPEEEPRAERKAKRKEPPQEVDDSKARRKPKAERKPEPEARAEKEPEPAARAEEGPEPGARAEKKPEPRAERRPLVDARSETQPETKIAQASAEEAEAKIARATDDRPARRGLVVVRGGSRGDGAQLWAVLALAASVVGAGVAIALQPSEERAPAPRVEAAVQPQPPALDPTPPPARPQREPAPAAESRARPGTAEIEQDLTEAVETLLAAGRERSAIELLASSRPSQAVTRARERVLTRAREVLDAAAGELRASAGRGEPSAPRLARLRARLPESLASELDALAAELSAIEGLAAAKARSRPAAPAGAAREPTDEPELEPIPVGPLAGRRMPPRPEPTEEPSRPEPEGAEPARPEPAREPEPEPRSEPEPEPSAGESSPDTDAVLADALRDRLKASHRVRDGMLEVDYGFTSDTDRQDWDGRGWDKFEINGVMGLATNHTSSSIALELGAGSNGAGVLHHALELAGDYTLEVGCWVAHSSARSQFVILAGKGGGVRWGTQLVKVSRGGGLKPLGPEPDRMGFRGERDVTIKVVRKGDTLEGTLNGASTGVKTFKPGELDGKVGIFASDVRLVISRFRITGKVDPRKL